MGLRATGSRQLSDYGRPGTDPPLSTAPLRMIGVSWWDAVIVAAAQALGCSILLTEDLQHGHAFGEVRVVDPFRSRELAPAEIVGAGGS